MDELKMEKAVREVEYKTYWEYGGRGIKRQDPLTDFLYLMEPTGVVPPLQGLNGVLQAGGNTDGIGPGTI